MNRFDISELLSGRLAGVDFEKRYSSELQNHRRYLQKEGGSAPVVLSGDDQVFIGTSAIRAVIRLYLDGGISCDMWRYLLDALSLDAQTAFDTEGLQELVMDLSDSGYQHAELERLLRSL